MSKYGGYLRNAQSIMNSLSGEKPHSSITDWIEVLSSDRYEEGSLDGIPELVDSVNLQGPQGTAEAARAVRKKLKYGNVHRQIRALVILRALTENAGHGFKLNWADERLMERLRDMAQDVSIGESRLHGEAAGVGGGSGGEGRRVERGQARSTGASVPQSRMAEKARLLCTIRYRAPRS